MLVQDVPEQGSAREGEGAFKAAPRAVEVINLGFASDLNTRSYKVVVEKTGQILASNQPSNSTRVSSLSARILQRSERWTTID